MSKESVEITYQDLKEKVDAGWKRDALAAHYNLKESQMAAALKQCGLTIKRTRKIPAFVVKGIPEVEQPSVEQKEVEVIETSQALEQSGNVEPSLDSQDKENTPSDPEPTEEKKSIPSEW